MSLASALLGLGIALTIVGTIGTIMAIVGVLATLEIGDRDDRRRSVTLLVSMVVVLGTGGFLLGLTIPAVST